MKKIELLSPAGSLESLFAAVQAGADAVYLGGAKFSARAYASNFDDDNMIKAVDYCHLYGVKIYVTVNTLIKEDEMEEALKYAEFLYKIGVDALIIQDSGLFYEIHRRLPGFEMHASTQMSIHNGESALTLKKLGFKRIVLARELGIDEIKNISKDYGIETEIFVHGALCICYSGQCLMSSMIGGRSGNRGRCAQPCRLPYTIYNKLSGQEKKGYLLSPKDICTLKHIKDIIESGTSSLKIEGRMKRPEYVAGVVSVYRNVIDNVCENKKDDFIEDEYKKLQQLFNREGFSNAYLYGNTGKDMMAYNYPKNTGLELGKVQKDNTLCLMENISIKDGVRNGEKGFTVSKILADGKEVPKADKGQKVKLFPSSYGYGDVLYKTSDSILNSELEKIYKNAYDRKIELSLAVEFKVGEPLALSTIYNGYVMLEKGSIVEKAISRPMTKEKIEENLRKSGETPFRFEHIEFKSFEEGFIPVSSINEVRRKLIKQIEDLETSRSKREVVKKESVEHIEIKGKHRDVPCAVACVKTKKQFDALASSGIVPALELSMFESEIDMDDIKDMEVYIKVPNIIKKEYDLVCGKINRLLQHVSGIITGNVAVMDRFKGKTKILGDYKLNVFNSSSIKFYSDFTDALALSVELNRSEINKIAKNTSIPLQVMVYGRIELMVSEYCPIGSVFGGRSCANSCSGSCKNGEYYLRDRMGVSFPIVTDKYCRSHIYNSIPLNLTDNLKDLRSINIKYFRLDFIDEDYDTTLNIIKAFKAENSSYGFEEAAYTRGHYKRGVE